MRADAEMKVTPEMLMKTKEGKKQVSGIRCQVSAKKSEVRSQEVFGCHSFRLLTSGSRLLTPVFCTSKNEGDSGDVNENKGRGKQLPGIRCQVSGRKSEVRRPKSAAPFAELGAVILTPDSCLLYFKNEGDSGDMYENKGKGKSDVRYQVPRVSEKVRSPRSGVRCRGTGGFQCTSPLSRLLTSGSRLLTPVSCITKMKVTPGICMKTKEGENQVPGIRCQVSAKKSGVRGPKSKIRRYSGRPCLAPLSAILTPDSCLLSPLNLFGDVPLPANYRLDFKECHPLP